MGMPIQWIRPGTRITGGSTLATQIEKYRHSPDGQTQGATDKLRQMVAASVRSYLDGQDTTYARRRIVVDYLNSTPLTARLGFGEVNGIGDGLWAWFGTDFNEAVRVLRSEPSKPAEIARRAQVYKQVLSLLIAQRRPSYYLIQNRVDLEELCDSHLRLMASQGAIPAELRDAALATGLGFREDTPAPPEVSFIDQKASNAIRARLLGTMGVPSLYALDRLDLTVDTALDAPMQERVANVLGRLNEAEFTQELGLTGFRLLNNSAAAADRVIYSFVLYERGKDTNHVRIQADNLDQPLDINEGAKLDLGSTAKLRTLITYLEIIQELHGRYAHLPRKQLLAVAEDADDGLTRWAASTLAESANRSLPSLLAAAMDRRYSASPGERFFTGGGVHTFVNFDNKDNGSVPTVTEAIRSSINLPFIRMMRDVVQYNVAEMVGETGNPLDDPSHPARQEYLAKFADEEGSHFQNRFYTDYRGKTPDERLALLASRVRPAPHRLAVTFRSVRPGAPFAEFRAFMRERLPKSTLDDKDLQRLFEKYAIDKFSLQDRGYIAGRHPLELWLVGYLNANPEATRAQAIAASTDERQETYAWLFKSSRKAAQDTRIRILMEEEAFKRIHTAWARLGYPFESLVPSYATSIGSSADRPGALADLMGVIVNDGVKLQTVRIEKLHFAAGTPYETAMSLAPRTPERVLSPEICATVRKALVDIAENGTAKRVRGAFTAPDGSVLAIGGKTGTGDHRYGERVVARTATFVFFIGDRFFGTITAHVRGPEAARYRFTSALPSQLLKSLAPTLQPLIDRSLTQTVESSPASGAN
jgi:membrane peptidoglycan carboxypeptidase